MSCCPYSKFEQVKSLVTTLKDSAVNIISGNGLFASSDAQGARLAICRSCSFLDVKQMLCNKCGCKLKIKVAVAAAKCPINLW